MIQTAVDAKKSSLRVPKSQDIGRVEKVVATKPYCQGMTQKNIQDSARRLQTIGNDALLQAHIRFYVGCTESTQRFPEETTKQAIFRGRRFGESS